MIKRVLWLGTTAFLIAAVGNCHSAPVGTFGSWEWWNKPEPSVTRARVQTLQYLLRARGHQPPVDGNFGSETRRQVARFQRSRGLRPTGSMDDATWETLVVRLKPGSRGPAVRALQVALNSTGRISAKLPVNGLYNGQTLKAVKEFQSHVNASPLIRPNGVVGPNTWRWLVAAPFSWDGWSGWEPRPQKARVQALQYLLRARGHPTPADGTFGSQTRAQVASFQRSRGLPPSGSMDDATWEALVVTLRPGSRGSAVEALQVMLRDWHLSGNLKVQAPLNGRFDTQTLRAVMELESDPDVDSHPDGVVDAKIWNDLIVGGLGGGIGADSESAQ